MNLLQIDARMALVVVEVKIRPQVLAGTLVTVPVVMGKAWAPGISSQSAVQESPDID